MFRPQGNPAELLGREARKNEQGQMVIAEELRPGCRVKSKPKPESWKRSYVTTLESVTGVDAEFGDIAQLKYNYGSRGKVEVSIANVERLDADLDGDCGEWVVSSVFVGTGSRFISASTEEGGSGGAKHLGVGAKGEHSTKSAEATTFQWDDAQGWMFSVKRRDTDFSPIELTAEMPPTLADGQKYRVYVHSNKQVWLLAYYREANGEVGKLLPNKENPQVALAAGERRPLPQLQVGLRDPKVEAREWLGLCAFDDVAHVRRFAPPKGEASPEQLKAWHSELPQKLEAIPSRSYRCEEIGYLIKPAEAAAEPTSPTGS